MSDTDVRMKVDAGVAVITLNRPEASNAFSGAMGEELGRAYRECDGDDAVRAVILTGSGTTFCVGADMSAGRATFAKRESEAFSAAGVDPPAWMVRKPVIAALNGHAIGIGLTLALQCDLRIIAREGRYGVLQVRRGMLPDAYSHWTLPRLVGIERAADLMLTGRKLSGEEAGAIGIASRVLPAEEVLPAARDIADEIARETAPLSVAVAKRLLWESPGLSWQQVGRRETELHHHLMGRPDAIEGVMAFLERRSPDWSSSVTKDWPEWPD